MYFVLCRNAGLGSCSFMARIGIIIAGSFAASLAQISIHILQGMFAGFALLSAAITIFLPETAGLKLPDTIDECKKIYGNQPVLQFLTWHKNVEEHMELSNENSKDTRENMRNNH